MNKNSQALPHEALKPDARAWFETLRDRICNAFEAIEDAPEAPALPLAERPAGRFERTAWKRPTHHSVVPDPGANPRLTSPARQPRAVSPEAAVS